MADYKAPLRDMRFVLNEVFEVSKLWAQLPALAEVVDEDTAAAILEEAGKVTGGVIAPLNRSGDEEGCSWEGGAVKTPAGFPDAYKPTPKVAGWASVVIRYSAAWACPRRSRPRSRKWSTRPTCRSACTRC